MMLPVTIKYVLVSVATVQSLPEIPYVHLKHVVKKKLQQFLMMPSLFFFDDNENLLLPHLFFYFIIFNLKLQHIFYKHALMLYKCKLQIFLWE